MALLGRIASGVLAGQSRRNFLPLSRAFCAPAALEPKEIDKLVKNNKVVVFMKGNPEAPRCGFSNAVVQILRMHSVTYDSHDVLSSDALRQGEKLRFCDNKDTLLNLFWTFEQESRITPTGQRFLRFSSTASLSAVATSCSRCTRMASWLTSCKRSASSRRWPGSRKGTRSRFRLRAMTCTFFCSINVCF